MPLLALLLFWPFPAAAVQDVLRAVVSILPLHSDPAAHLREPEGSGILIDRDCTIVTAAHVIGDATRILVRNWDGDLAPAALLYADRRTDLAFLCLDAQAMAAWSLPVLKFNTAPQLAMPVCAIGNAFGLDLSITCGIISALHRAGTGFNEIEDFLQTDAAVNPGMSGGALVDSEHRLVGLLAAIYSKQADANNGVSFAVSAALILRSHAMLQQSGRIRWPQPDLLLDPVEADPAGFRLGAVIAEVKAGTLAEAAGFQPGDILIRAGQRRIRSAADWRSAMALRGQKQILSIEILRHDGTGARRLKLNYGTRP